MGIKGIYNEIGQGDRISLAKLAIEFFEKQGRPLRLAIDISIWLFQIQSGEGGSNPALRTFYYRLLRMISLSIHPVFVFDGPNKPPIKRNKRTLGPGVKTVSIPEFLAKQLLQHFALPIHLAPGEAEAECALLQRLGYVDAVLSEDADTLMFGSGVTLRNLSPEGSLKTKVATHVNVYDADKVKATSGLDREGMILVALMSGGDYVPEGIPGCGPKIACQAARAGFGSELCKIERDDCHGLAAWKYRLEHELHTNESKLFSRKNRSLKIPEDFPRRDILKYYTHPCVSSDRTLAEQLPRNLQWDKDIDIRALRAFAGDAFEWFYLSGAKKFIRNLAPALLARELRLQGSRSDALSDDLEKTAANENRLVKSIHLKRNHISTDQTTELRVGFIPLDLVALDLDSETPDPETTDDNDLDEEDIVAVDCNEEPSSPKKKRGPSTYDPSNLEKIWLLESIVRIGVPLKVQDWEGSIREVQKTKSSKTRAREAGKSPTKSKHGGTPLGSLDRFTSVMKPANSQPASPDQSPTRIQRAETCNDSLQSPPKPSELGNAHSPCLRPKFQMPKPLPAGATHNRVIPLISLLSSPEKPLSRPSIQRSQSNTSGAETTGQVDTIGLSNSHQNLDVSAPVTRADEYVPSRLTESVTTRYQRSSIRRSRTISNDFTASPVGEQPEDHTSHAFFQRPPGFLQSPSRGADVSQTLVSVGQISRSPQRPSTPPTNICTTWKERSRPVETINLCSSPATPRRHQKSIREWVTPRKSVAGPLAVVENVTETDDLGSNLVRAGREDERGLEEAHLSHRIPLTEATDGLLNASIHLQSRSQEPTQPPKTAQHTKNTIRLSESIEGAWEIRSTSFTTASSSSSEDVENGQGRKRKRTQWRVSQVEVLDLTQA